MSRVYITGSRSWLGRQILSSTGTHDLKAGNLDQISVDLKGHEAILHIDELLTEHPSVGITFEKSIVEGMRELIACARQQGSPRILYVSLIGSRPNAVSPLAQAKYSAEQILTQSGLAHIIVRLAPLIGPGDGQTEALAHMVRYFPLLPYVNIHSMMQPVDVADAVTLIFKLLDLPEALGQTYNIGGEDRVSLGQLLDLLMQMSGKRRLKLPLSYEFIKTFIGLTPWLRLPFAATPDQFLLLQENRICSQRSIPHHFHFQPRPLADVLKKYFLG